jgi:hypothetical protein
MYCRCDDLVATVLYFLILALFLIILISLYWKYLGVKWNSYVMSLLGLSKNNFRVIEKFTLSVMNFYVKNVTVTKFVSNDLSFYVPFKYFWVLTNSWIESEQKFIDWITKNVGLTAECIFIKPNNDEEWFILLLILKSSEIRIFF